MLTACCGPPSQRLLPPRSSYSTTGPYGFESSAAGEALREDPDFAPEHTCYPKSAPGRPAPVVFQHISQSAVKSRSGVGEDCSTAETRTIGRAVRTQLFVLSSGQRRDVWILAVSAKVAAASAHECLPAL